MTFAEEVIWWLSVIVMGAVLSFGFDAARCFFRHIHGVRRDR